jgi:hypothetical protein
MHDKGKLLYNRRSVCTALRIENSPTQIALFSKIICQHLEQMLFFQDMEILRRDVQVLDHISAMEIKTHFILNLQRPTVRLLPRMPGQPGLLYRSDLQGEGLH